MTKLGKYSDFGNNLEPYTLNEIVPFADAQKKQSISGWCVYTEEEEDSFLVPTQFRLSYEGIKNIEYLPASCVIHMQKVLFAPLDFPKEEKKGDLALLSKIITQFRVLLKKEKEHFVSIGWSWLRVESIFSDILNQILTEFTPKTINISVSEDATIDMHLISKNKSIYLDLFFEENNQKSALLNVYENKKCLYSYDGSLENSLSKLKKFVDDEHIYIP